MCKVVLVEIFWRNGVEKKKTPDTFHRGSSDQDTYTHRPYLDLDFRKNVTWQGRRQKRNLAGEAPKNVTWQGRHQKT